VAKFHTKENSALSLSLFLFFQEESTKASPKTKGKKKALNELKLVVEPSGFSFINLVLWNLFEFSVAEITSKFQISPTF
jgi:hypothetical protein